MFSTPHASSATHTSSLVQTSCHETERAARSASSNILVDKAVDCKKKNGARQSHKKLKRCTLLWNIKAKAKANMFELTRASTIIILLFYSICRAGHFLTKVC